MLKYVETKIPKRHNAAILVSWNSWWCNIFWIPLTLSIFFLLVLPYINMNPPWVYTCSHSITRPPAADVPWPPGSTPTPNPPTEAGAHFGSRNPCDGPQRGHAEDHRQKHLGNGGSKFCPYRASRGKWILCNFSWNSPTWNADSSLLKEKGFKIGCVNWPSLVT